MASNALSRRGTFTRHPKVCHAPPNPGRCEPPPPPSAAACSIDPPTDTDIPGNDIELTVLASHPDLPDGDPVSSVLDGGGSSFTLDFPLLNGDPTPAVCTSEVEGIFALTATMTFSDSSECIATAVMTFEEN